MNPWQIKGFYFVWMCSTALVVRLFQRVWKCGSPKLACRSSSGWGLACLRLAAICQIWLPVEKALCSSGVWCLFFPPKPSSHITLEMFLGWDLRESFNDQIGWNWVTCLTHSKPCAPKELKRLPLRWSSNEAQERQIKSRLFHTKDDISTRAFSIYSRSSPCFRKRKRRQTLYHIEIQVLLNFYGQVLVVTPRPVLSVQLRPPMTNLKWR